MADKQAATAVSEPAHAAEEDSGSEDQEEEEKVVDMASPPAAASDVAPPGRTDSSEMLLDGVPSDCLGLASAAAAGYERLPRARSHDDRDPNCASPDKEKRSPKKLLGRFFDKKKGVAGEHGHVHGNTQTRANAHPPPAPPEEKEVGEVSTAAVTATPAAGAVAGTAAGGAEEKKKKKRSSWLPDPERRWPIQGFY